MFVIKSKLTFFFVIATLLLFVYCQPQQQVIQNNLPYLNVANEVKMVGSEQCRSCHAEKYNTFINTGMGKSWDVASKQKTSASFNSHSLVYDTINNFYYRPFFKNDTMFIAEFRIDKNGDTTHFRKQTISYIVGSGQHTNSHIINQNGYLFQAPITFYTQKGIWDLAPGFNSGANSRFKRIIGMECMSCHNSYPEFVDGSENKYLRVEKGIGCERCHGAGELHVKQKLAGITVDTSKNIDYTIVNPKKLPRDLQMNVCQRCHLQGIAVLNEGKNFDDFKPSMPLNKVMQVFLPEYDGNQTQFIMASQAHRLSKSACYKNSEMTCISCHNPHISVKATMPNIFNNKCEGCHTQKKCSVLEQKRISANNNNCFECHMKPSPSIDIPHVTVHDHFIRRPIAANELQNIENFIGLQCVTDTAVSPILQAQGYLHYFESYAPNPIYLDSAYYYIKQAGNYNAVGEFSTKVHYWYLKNDFLKLIEIANQYPVEKIKDAWTAYRIGEAFLQQKNYDKALIYFGKAVQILPLQLDFLNKLGTVQLQLGNTEQALNVFDKILNENPQHVSALTNLGYIYVFMGNTTKAKQLYDKCYAISPDYEINLLNLAAWYLLQRNKVDAEKVLQKVINKNPNQEQAKQLLNDLKKTF